MDSLDDLPIEIILVILSYMTFDTLMILSQTSKKYYFPIHEEIISGQLVIDLELDKKIEDDEIKPKLEDFPNLRSLKLVHHFEDLQAKSLYRSPVVAEFYGTGIEIWAGFGPNGQISCLYSFKIF